MEPEVFNLFFETKDDSQKQVAVTPKRKLIPYVLGMLGCVVAVVLFLALRLGGKQTELGYTAKNDSILDETRFIRVSENQENVEYSLKKGNSPEEVALSALPKKLKREKGKGKQIIKVNLYVS